MNLKNRTKLDFSILVQSLTIIFLITAEISADSNASKKPAPTQPNQKNLGVTPTKNRPPISEGSKPSNPIPAKNKPNNPPVTIPEVVKQTPMPVPAKPVNPPITIPEVVKPKPMPVPAKPAILPITIPEVVKPKPIPLPKKPIEPPVSIPEVVKPMPTPVPAKPANPLVTIPEVVKPMPTPVPAKPTNPPITIPEVVKPKPMPLPAKPANPLVTIPEVVKPKPVPLRRPIVSDKKPLPSAQPTKASIQEPSSRFTTFVDSNNRRNIPNNQNYYHQQTVRDFYEHTRKYPQPSFRNQGNNNNFNTYSWVNNNRYFYGYNFRNYNYITCYDRFNNRFTIITVPCENLNYPVVIQPYPPVIIQPYPVNCYQAFDSTGFLSPILMLLRITQGNYIW